MDKNLERRPRWRRLFGGVRGRLFGSYGALVLVLLVGLSVAFSSMQTLRTHFTHTVSTVDALSETVVRVVKLQDDQETSMRGYLLTGDRVFLEPYDAAARTLPALYSRAKQLIAHDATERALLVAMARDARAWQGWASPYLEAPSARLRAAPGFVAGMVRGKTLFDHFRQSSSALTDHLAAQRAADLQDSLATVQRSGGIFFWVLILTVTAVVVVGWLATRGITRSLDQLAGAATLIGRGDLDSPIAIAGAAEFTQLGRQMDRTRRYLRTQRTLAELLGSSLRLDTVWTGFALQAHDLVPFDHLSLSEIDGDEMTMTTLYAEGLANEGAGAGTTNALPAVSASLIQPDQRYLIHPDLAGTPPEPAFADTNALALAGLRAHAVVPLRVKGRMIGSLNLGNIQAGTYTEASLGPVLSLAPLVGAAMDNSRLYTSLDETNAALEHANRELGAFAYSVSHDLRAPLRGIAGFSQAILEDYADKLDDEGKGYLQQVIGASREMGQLIDDLLRLSRVTRAELQRQPTDLSALAWVVIPELTRSAPERQVEFSIKEHLMVEGDAHLLRVMLENLLGNAWKFTRPTPTARIELDTVWREGRQVYVIRDNGAGFDMAYADKLFGAFQRLHGAEFEGTGIGLATAQRVVHRHGGQIWAEGVVGKGASFYFTLSSTERER